jgi:hypothetical protein
MAVSRILSALDPRFTDFKRSMGGDNVKRTEAFRRNAVGICFTPFGRLDIARRRRS